MFRRVLGFTLLAALLVSSVLALHTPSQAAPPEGGGPGMPSGGGPPPEGGRFGQRPMGGMRPGGMPVDSFASDRDSMAKIVLEHIAGREEQPAESVFRNIKVLKSMPAGRLVRLMDMGFGRSLGVGCEHCHVPGHWADEDKKQKQVARDMMAMADTINRVLLARIPNLQSKQPHVNCGTCHHGSPRPGAEMAGQRPGGGDRPAR